MNKIVKTLFIIILLVFLFFIYIFFIAKAPVQKNITWGVNFSQAQAVYLKLDWKKTYLAILEDLGLKHIKLLTQWDFIEGEKGQYFFEDVDWQIKEAEKNNAKLIYVVGMKSGRWPECHLPDWASSLSKQEQQAELLKYIKEVVLKYKENKSIIAWQAENEPFFKFGVCPWYDVNFLKKEVKLIKSIDPTRPVIISDSGEQSLWIEAARIGDIVGSTMYRRIWVHIIGDVGFYIKVPIPSVSYWMKTQIIKKVFNKKVINVELQAEPWGYETFDKLSLGEQAKTMDINKFKENIAYAKQTGFDTFYFWGTEWWYWLKETQNKPEIWNEAKKLFQNP